MCMRVPVLHVPVCLKLTSLGPALAVQDIQLSPTKCAEAPALMTPNMQVRSVYYTLNNYTTGSMKCDIGLHVKWCVSGALRSR